MFALMQYFPRRDTYSHLQRQMSSRYVRFVPALLDCYTELTLTVEISNDLTLFLYKSKVVTNTRKLSITRLQLCRSFY